MSDKILLVQGDTKPLIVISLTDTATGDPIDISAATVLLKFRAVGTTTILATSIAIKLAGIVLDDGTINSTAPYNVPGKGGRAQFPWAVGDLNQPAGNYEGEIVVDYSDGTIQTVYDVLKFQIRQEF